MATTYLKARIYKLDTNILQSDPAQPRKFIDPGSLAELSASISKVGVIQPILFRVGETGGVIIVAGERRVAAAKMAGLTTIPAVLVAENYQEIALIENLQRVDLTPVEEAEALDRMMKDHGYTQTQLSEMIGKTQAGISQTLTIVKLPEDIRNQCRTNPNIPRTILLDIAKVKTEQSQRNKFKRYMDKAAKPSPQTGRTPRPSKERALIQKTDLLHGELAGLPWRDWKVEDKEDLAMVLRDMHQLTEEILRDMGEPMDQGAPETESISNLK